MIEFESDDRTCGEQLLLRVVLLGCTPAQLGWDHLDASDFSHDLHGRIFRHAVRLGAGGVAPRLSAVVAALSSDRRMRLRDGVREYLEWLTGDECPAMSCPYDAWNAFHVASLERYEARVRAAARRHA